jgi:hypothetical protein
MFSMKFKKGGSGSQNRIRLYFLAASAVAIIMAVVLKLNWSIIPLGVFIAYILLNFFAALFKLKF